MPKGSQTVTAGGDLHPALKIISGRDYSIIKYACKYPNVSDDNLPYRHIRSLPIQEKNRHIGSYLKNAEQTGGCFMKNGVCILNKTGFILRVVHPLTRCYTDTASLSLYGENTHEKS